MTQSEQWLEGAGGRIFVRHFEPEGKARANLIICHGFNAHSGHYERAAADFAAAGLAVTAADLRGRGKSDGERFYVDSVDDYAADLAQSVELGRSRHPELPTYLLGHSAGGVTAVIYALGHQDRIDGLICESFAYKVYAPDFALKLLEGASHLAPHAHVLKLKNADFSRDPAWVAMLDADPLIHDESQPLQTAAALARGGERLNREFGRIALPLLILHGTEDHATRPEGSEQFHRDAASADKTLKLYTGHYHDLLNDVGREQVTRDVIDWIDARLPIREDAAIAETHVTAS